METASANQTKEPVAADHEDQADDDDDDEDLEKLQAEIAKMEEQAALIAKENELLQRKRDQVIGNKTADDPNKATTSEKTQLQRDGNSIYVGQVDYSTTPEELLAHFEACGSVERVTIVWYVDIDNEKGINLQKESSLTDKLNFAFSYILQR
jgi:polyadenylate-binding protein 2